MARGDRGGACACGREEAIGYYGREGGVLGQWASRFQDCHRILDVIIS